MFLLDSSMKLMSRKWIFSISEQIQGFDIFRNKNRGDKKKLLKRKQRRAFLILTAAELIHDDDDEAELDEV